MLISSTMGLQGHCSVIIFLLILCMVSSSLGAMTAFNVVRYGAAGNGLTDDSQAFLKAWKAACQDYTGPNIPVVQIPPKKTYFLNPLTFQGPCKSPRIYMQVSGRMVAPLKSRWMGKQKQAWVIFRNVNGLVMSGNAVFDAQGSSWWPKSPCYNDPANGVFCKGPTGMIFHRCNGIRLSGLTKVNGPGSQILILSSKDVVATNLRVIAPGDSPNTDGIDISGSTSVQIRNSFIATGDDCIAISGGSSNVYVSGITCGPGHGISIGALGQGGENDIVENVRVRNCTLKGTLTGVRIKTWQGGKGYARRISFEGIKFIAVNNPIQIDQYYCPLQTNCKNFTSAVAVSDITYNGITGTSASPNVINLSCSQTLGCKNINLNQVYIKSSIPGNRVYSTCYNAHGKATHTSPAVKCLLP